MSQALAGCDPAHMLQLRRSILRLTGISIPPQKQYLLEARMEKLLHQESIPDLGTFLARLDSGDPGSFDALVRHVTTNHTYFFREADHLTDLALRLLGRSPGTVKIWSAACSSGEEPYSIIMQLLERGIQDFMVLGSDINSQVLHKAAQGEYSGPRLEQLPAPLRLKYFSSQGSEGWKVKNALRSRLRIKKLNLVEPLIFEEPFDYIFCRNLLIYLDEDNIRRVVDNCVANLRVGGCLYIGQAEILFTPPVQLQKVGTSVYQKIRE